MMPFIMFSTFAYAFFCGWDLLICLGGIVTLIYSGHDKKYGSMCLSITFLGFAVIWWQLICEIGDTSSVEMMDSFCRILGRCPMILCVILHVTVSILLVILLRGFRQYHKKHISPFSIKICADNMPRGLCYWNDYGRVLFSNRCMNQLCIDILGNPLLDGFSLSKSVKDIMMVGDRVWRMSIKDISYDKEIIHEMIATDITDIYQKTSELKKENKEIENLTKEMRELSHNIDDMVRKEEILHARVNIHDEMNRLLLMTDATNPDDAEEMNQIFSMWEHNALFLCKEAAGETFENNVSRIEQLAQALGIALIWKKQIPETMSDSQRKLFFMAAQEALANVAKHTTAKELIFSFEETMSSILCYFENENSVKNEGVKFTGGLSNLERLAKKQNAKLKAECHETFVLILEFDK